MRILGIDLGEKRIGVAVSDPMGIIAQGVTVIKSAGALENIEKIKEIADKYGDVSEIIIGLPKTLKGEIGIEAEKALKFKELLEEKTSIPVKTWDERFTTKEAERTLIEAGVKRKKRKDIVDKTAATYLLQGYLDSKK
ncbi:MAG: Holliday junction resolvase RuvX [Candidatus Saganbacteria bacterium]|nr:Holliday junction resolvase RuvX [Candidatus Saganbacteria bacterium]